MSAETHGQNPQVPSPSSSITAVPDIYPAPPSTPCLQLSLPTRTQSPPNYHRTPRRRRDHTLRRVRFHSVVSLEQRERRAERRVMPFIHASIEWTTQTKARARDRSRAWLTPRWKPNPAPVCPHHRVQALPPSPRTIRHLYARKNASASPGSPNARAFLTAGGTGKLPAQT